MIRDCRWMITWHSFDMGKVRENFCRTVQANELQIIPAFLWKALPSKEYKTNRYPGSQGQSSMDSNRVCQTMLSSQMCFTQSSKFCNGKCSLSTYSWVLCSWCQQQEAYYEQNAAALTSTQPSVSKSRTGRMLKAEEPRCIPRTIPPYPTLILWHKSKMESQSAVLPWK